MATSSFLPPKRSGRGISCLIGCLIIFLLFILITAVLIGVIYYFLFLREKEPGSYFEVDFSTAKTVDCEGSLVCLDSNFKKCVPAKGTTDMGDFAQLLTRAGFITDNLELTELESVGDLIDALSSHEELK